MRILITGATGLIGQEIAKQCRKEKIKINYLTTTKSKIVYKEDYHGYYWNPDRKEIDIECFEDVSAIIHLAGASIAKRWTSSYREKIISSRVDTAQLLIDSLSKIEHTVEQIISSSAIGVYPDSLINYYDESFSNFDESFLSDVVQKWELAVDGFRSLGIQTAKVRTGLVLSDNGGALPQMLKPIKLGMGAAFGSGKQWQSWIHIKDLARIFIYILNNELSGVFNGVAPNPVSNTELTRLIAKKLHKPLFLPNIPRLVMKLALGDMHKILFESQRVSSKKIEDEGFNFKYNTLKPALEELLQ